LEIEGGNLVQAGWKPGISKYAALLGILCCLFWVGITGSNYPALATVQGPEQIILTWTDDPASTQTVTWLSPDTTASQLQYMPAVDFNGDFPNASIIEAQMSPFGSSNYRYQAHITGLTADTSYVYRVGSAEAWSETLSFTTAADSDTFSFLYLGDVQEGYEEWEDLLDFIKQNHPQIKFSLLGGDLANNDNEWGQFLTAASPYFSQVPMMPTLGNHDGYMYLNFFSLPGNGPEGLKKEFYSFDYGNAHFVVLNSGNNTSPEAKEWLKTDLQNTSQTWKFAMFHYPAYPAFDDNKTIDESICENWVPILEANGVDMVFVGHQHQYMRTYPIYQGETQTGVESYGIVYIMGNSGSKHYGAGAGFPYIDCQETGSNYQLIEIEGEVLTLTSRKANGELIEVYTIDKRKYPPLLQSVSLNPVIGQSIDISFTDDPAWRGSISSIRVGGIELNSDQYTLSEGNIHISAQVFKQAGNFEIVVSATGYRDASVIQSILDNEGSAGCYSLVSVDDDSYYSRINQDGIHYMTVNPGIGGFRYFTVSIDPIIPHSGDETVVFTHLRNGIQLAINATRADFDQLHIAQAGFNVKTGDLIKVFIVDVLTNEVDNNPVILQ
jgi:hypothetical protein